MERVSVADMAYRLIMKSYYRDIRSGSPTDFYLMSGKMDDAAMNFIRTSLEASRACRFLEAYRDSHFGLEIGEYDNHVLFKHHPAFDGMELVFVDPLKTSPRDIVDGELTGRALNLFQKRVEIRGSDSQPPLMVLGELSYVDALLWTAESHLPALAGLINKIGKEKEIRKCENCQEHLKDTRKAFNEFMDIVHSAPKKNPILNTETECSSKNHVNPMKDPGTVLVIPSILNEKRAHRPELWSELFESMIELD